MARGWFKRRLRKFGRTIDRATKGVTRTIKKIPVAGHALKLGEKTLKGPIGKTFNKIMTNPVVSTAFGPVAVPANIVYGAATDGVRGASRAAKAELRNPVRQAAVKAIGTVFPPAAPAAVALEASRRLLDAAEKGSPEEAAKAAMQIAANVALADGGDEHAKAVLSTIDKARDLRAKVAGVTVPMRKVTKLWHTDEVARSLISPDVHAAIKPGNFQAALSGLARASQGKLAPAEVQRHADLVAATLHAATSHRAPLFALMGKVAHGELEKIADAPHGEAVLNLVEKKLMTKSLKGSNAINRVVHLFNARDPRAVELVAKLKSGVAKGDTASAARYDQLRRRTAAIRKAGEFHVDSTGMVRHHPRTRAQAFKRAPSAH